VRRFPERPLPFPGPENLGTYRRLERRYMYRVGVERGFRDTLGLVTSNDNHYTAFIVETVEANNDFSPQEAAMAIGRLANHRNPHVAILALALLDTLVQSCGYPFHLQISTKDFFKRTSASVP